jgi:circadian clock protein KaiC
MASHTTLSEPGSGSGVASPSAGLSKAGSGIRGLDEITRGGLPAGRVTLVAGEAGTGKTVLGLQFLVAGAREFGEPGVLVTFEERNCREKFKTSST